MWYKKAIIIILVLIFFISLGYWAVFGRALRQSENHFGIALALPKVILSSEAARIDEKAYLAKDNSSFIYKIEQSGFKYIEQLGSGYIFEKDGEKYVSASRRYSSYFLVFSEPIKIK